MKLVEFTGKQANKEGRTRWGCEVFLNDEWVSVGGGKGVLFVPEYKYRGPKLESVERSPLEQAIYESGYALTERERNIAEYFWNAGMASHQTTP